MSGKIRDQLASKFSTMALIQVNLAVAAADFEETVTQEAVAGAFVEKRPPLFAGR